MAGRHGEHQFGGESVSEESIDQTPGLLADPSFPSRAKLHGGQRFGPRTDFPPS